MRVPNYFLATAVSFSLLAGVACQSTHSAAALAPPHAAPPALTAVNVPAPPQADDKSRQLEAAPPVPKPDPVAALVVDVEKEFQLGQDNLKAVDHEDAGHNFDRAFAMLVASPLEEQADPRLQSERERILTAQKSLE